MPVITLPDGSQKQFDHHVSVADIATGIGPGLAKAALAALSRPAERGRIGLARFFAEKLATAAPGLAHSILSGAAPLDGCAAMLAESV